MLPFAYVTHYGKTTRRDLERITEVDKLIIIIIMIVSIIVVVEVVAVLAVT
jgi:cell division protein FtsL